MADGLVCEELIPVLKALRSDPTTSPVFADWFEDRGEVELAAYLRGGDAEKLSGYWLVRNLNYLAGRYCTRKNANAVLGAVLALPFDRKLDMQHTR